MKGTSCSAFAELACAEHFRRITELPVCRIDAFGFIDSFTNKLNPNIESIQHKVKTFINFEVTSRTGPSDAMMRKPHAPFAARPPGGNARGACEAKQATVRAARELSTELPIPP